uniref:Putative secreted protein n=1 Tax=Amblyomma cajennense TaxID=34607 RepID=A0A023FR73_AMBCJ
MASHSAVGVLLLAAASLLGSSQAQLKPGCKIDQLRACGSDYVPFVTRTYLHEGGDKFKDACALDNKQIACTLKFVEDCLEGLPRVAAQLAIKSMEESYEATCSEGTDQNKLYKNGVKCLNAHGTQLHGCMSSLSDKLQRGTTKAPVKEVIHYSCCAYHEALQCVEESLADCDTDAGREFMAGSMESIFGETLSLVCGAYSRGSRACQELPKLPELGADEPRITNVIEQAISVASSLGKKE